MSNTTAKPNRELAQILSGELVSGRRIKFFRWVLGILALFALVIGFRLFSSRTKNVIPRFETEQVTRGTLRVTVSATGNLAPTNRVDVGSELSGL